MNESHTFQREIKHVHRTEVNQVSDIHKNRLLLKPGNWSEFDPFLLLAEDWFQKGSFAQHPHRGMETVTYVIEGKLEHYDNRAGEGALMPGDVQWMTAGKGVIHLEDPAEGETVHSLQLWVNLPSDKKMSEPRYQNLSRGDMPIRREDGAIITVFSGSSAGIQSSTLNHVPITMVEMNIEPHASVSQDLPGGYNGFIYVLEGEGEFGKEKTVGKKGEILWLGSADEASHSHIRIHAKESLQVLLYAGQPIKETVVANGPFVMNTEQEIRQAYSDYRDGKFAE